ncbi:acyl-CoA N-acyltransferase [Mycena metata]|uniref:Acyl-CoA N-acyltransferase n=1 Tax=Mycena metata TaxID=1033252 RepID=A0AAD7K8W7_9AGAR|nr:acyl-CoA N-acyltransferase [Mycena metata]
MILEENLECISPRVVLVPPSESDDAPFAALRCHPETRRYLPFVPDHCSPQEARELRTSRAPDRTRIDFSIYVATQGSPPKYAGAVGILNINETFNACDAGISIVPEYFRAGIATEALYGLLRYAFEDRKLHRVVFHTAITNIRMRGWLERFGAPLEGTLRESLPDGNSGYTDACVYGILEQEWVQVIKAKMEERINGV